MDIETLLANVPDYAKDLKLNLPNVLRQQELTEQQLWGTAVSTAIASRNPEMTEAILSEAAKHLSPEAMYAAKGAAAIMGMNNIYYRALHLMSNPRYSGQPARLRMQVIRNHGSDPADFELWCMAASAVKGCGSCLDSHEKVVREKGISEEAVIAALRIASVIHALAAIMDAVRVERNISSAAVL